jgi:hypothetical protein
VVVSPGASVASTLLGILLPIRKLEVDLQADGTSTDAQGTRVDRETSTVQFPPVVVPNYDGVLDKVIRIVGVSNEFAKSANAG